MPLETERNNQVVAMREQGIPYRKIGRHFGISADRVRQIVIRCKHKQEIFEKWPFSTLLSHRARMVLGSNPVRIYFGWAKVVNLSNISFNQRFSNRIRRCLENATFHMLNRCMQAKKNVTK